MNPNEYRQSFEQDIPDKKIKWNPEKIKPGTKDFREDPPVMVRNRFEQDVQEVK